MEKFYKVMSVPTITYGSEVWTMNKKDKTRIQSAEMRFLRSVGGYRREDRKRNVDIRQELNINELNTTIHNYRDKWKSHVNRMSQQRIPQIMYKYRPVGKRSLGRPRTRWRDQE